MFPWKAIAALVAGMISIAFWTVAVVTFWKGTFTAEALAALATSTTTLAAAFAAALIPDKIESAERKRLNEDLRKVMSQ